MFHEDTLLFWCGSCDLADLASNPAGWSPDSSLPGSGQTLRKLNLACNGIRQVCAGKSWFRKKLGSSLRHILGLL
jgi:hypothetical protein